MMIEELGGVLSLFERPSEDEVPSRNYTTTGPCLWLVHMDTMIIAASLDLQPKVMPPILNIRFLLLTSVACWSDEWLVKIE